ncbi:hypothetical protein TNCV_2013941 [Trichonephila clavipes]|nr:hypothetical protein TNCV_2013941 [Trichonephila clavipes]
MPQADPAHQTTVPGKYPSTPEDKQERSGTAVNIPDAPFDLTPGSVTKYTTLCSIRIQTASVCQGLIRCIIYDQVPAA